MLQIFSYGSVLESPSGDVPKPILQLLVRNLGKPSHVGAKRLRAYNISAAILSPNNFLPIPSLCVTYSECIVHL